MVGIKEAFFNKYFFYAVKEIADKLFSIIILLVFIPVLIIILLILAITNNGKPFFFQLRPGKNEKIFKLIKFRTMNDGKDTDGNLLPDSKRLTKIGKFLRQTSLDELPQLINVLKGEMSIVGPRPLLVQYLPLYNDTQRKRHNVKPGITGLAQVNGRNAISWSQKFEYDVWYSENKSILLDIKILILTIKKVIFADGITNGIEETTEAFNGKN